MFQTACKDLLTTVMPIVIAWRNAGGALGFTIGAGLIINKDGWFVTAAHILERVNNLYEGVTGTSRHKGRRKDRVTQYAVIWGGTDAQVHSAAGNSGVDIGLGNLVGYKPPDGIRFPRLRDRDVEQGELLCRAGYPFVDGVKLEWSEEKGFIFTNLFPVPMFVNEAMVSRFVQLNEGIWIETSSPGLKGQSGGPLVDADGFVCGIQVNTNHYPLGFSGRGRNQILNVGRAVHVRTVREYLDKNGVQYNT